MEAQQHLDTFLAKFTPEVESVARDCVAYLRRRIPTAVQIVYDNYNALAIGFGPDEGASKAILSIAVYPRWVGLFFLQGVHLPDPHKLLRGSGNKVRHIVLKSADQLATQPIEQLIEEALRTAKVPIDPEQEGRLVIRSIAARQRPRRP